MNELTILNAGFSDLSNLRKLEEVCFPEDKWPLLDLIGVLTMPGVVRKKALYKDNFAGFIAGDVRKRQDLGIIMTIGVFPAFRGLGIGKKLLETCEKEIGMSRLTLTVRKSNYPAINLYVKAGYVQKDIWQNYYIGNEDGIVFEKKR